MDNLDEKRVAKWVERPSTFVADVLGKPDEAPFDYQAAFLDSPKSRKAFVSGRQVGKSRTCAWMAIHHAVLNPDSITLLVAPTQRQSTELMNTIKRELSLSQVSKQNWGVERDIATEIAFDNGARIISLPTGRDGSNIRGYTAELIIVDEAAYVEDNIFTQVLEPMLAVTHGTLVLASTPFGASGYLYQKWTQDDDFYTKQVPTSQNPFVDDEWIEKQRRNLPRMQFRQEYLGEFVEQADLFFGREDVMRCLVQGEDEDNPDFITKQSNICYLGVDIAQHGEDESVFISMDSEGNVFSIEHTADTDLTDSIGRIKALDNFHNYNKILIDATGLGAGVVDTCRERIGRKVEGYAFNSIDKKQALYQNARRQMQDGEISFALTDEGRILKQQLMGMRQSFTSTGKVKIEEPDDMPRDDHADAFVLACWARSQRPSANAFKGMVDLGNYGPSR